MIPAKDQFTYEIIYNTYSLSQLARSSSEFGINKAHCMMNIWNIDIFERDYNILCSNKLWDQIHMF